jgi:hypothetical protein
MKYFLLAVAVIVGSGLLFGKLASDFVDHEQKSYLQRQCEKIGNNHPDCKPQ